MEIPKLHELLSVVIISSPSPSHPSTSLVDVVLSSLDVLDPALSTCQVFVILDGYEIRDKARPKCGQVTVDMVRKYDGYHQALLAKAERLEGRKLNIIRHDSHQGFSMCVQHALLHSPTPYALVCQHDRKFTASFPFLLKLIQLLESNEQWKHIRYVGFPSVTNANHRFILDHLGLKCLNSFPNVLPLDNLPMYSPFDASTTLSLQPLAFWFDSNHLAHCERYLEIYKPFTYIPTDIKEIISKERGNQEDATKMIKKMVLKKGDFIEDRWGQLQRILLSSLRAEGEQVITRVFRWYGTYLIWIEGNDNGNNSSNSNSSNSNSNNVTKAGGGVCGNNVIDKKGSNEPLVECMDYIFNLNGCEEEEEEVIDSDRDSGNIGKEEEVDEGEDYVDDDDLHRDKVKGKGDEVGEEVRRDELTSEQASEEQDAATESTKGSFTLRHMKESPSPSVNECATMATTGMSREYTHAKVMVSHLRGRTSETVRGYDYN